LSVVVVAAEIAVGWVVRGETTALLSSSNGTRDDGTRSVVGGTAEVLGGVVSLSGGLTAILVDADRSSRAALGLDVVDGARAAAFVFFRDLEEVVAIFTALLVIRERRVTAAFKSFTLEDLGTTACADSIVVRGFTTAREGLSVLRSVNFASADEDDDSEKERNHQNRLHCVCVGCGVASVFFFCKKQRTKEKW